MNIGAMIKSERKRQNISMNTLAKRAEIGQSTLSYIESGQRQPTFEVIERIVKGLGLTLGEFFTKEKSELEPELRRLVDTAKKLTPEQRESLQRLLDAINKD
ncbi:MAG TPA: helix-turn-helix transcriptional regulator [Methylomusa anaerophila]|nr:helix-turn-helix transcriptional regulator [Methylomusa anaerophila]HML90398.1 helix-turn-helix transcriptional regulator [Methylomusa anaerophila]